MVEIHSVTAFTEISAATRRASLLLFLLYIEAGIIQVTYALLTTRKFSSTIGKRRDLPYSLVPRKILCPLPNPRQKFKYKPLRRIRETAAPATSKV